MADISSLYRDAGVDINAGNRLIERIKPLAESTRRAEVMEGLGGFASLFRFPRTRFRDPILVSGTDGVGTKLKLALEAGRLDGLGRDLVAMCVNDVAVSGAEPLFFLDYYATARLRINQAERLVAGIAVGCREAGCALVGGETAELPGLYQNGEFDLAGFCVGVVEREALIDGKAVEPRDAVLGIASSGTHANGYSLIRRVIDQSGARLDHPLGSRTLADWLLAPTTIYVRAIRTLLETGPIHALAHITGGGIVENLPRVLPPGCRAVIDPADWPRPQIFDWLAQAGQIPEPEMFRVFNMGLGLIAILPQAGIEPARAGLAKLGLDAWQVGSIEPGEPGVCLDHR